MPSTGFIALLVFAAILLPTGEARALTERDILAAAHARIEQYRKADATLRVADRRGRPIGGARVQVRQVRHAFLFGCNAFHVLSYKDPAQEAAYEREFAALFNYATLPFYWNMYEPASGRTNQAQLEAMARWCRQQGIAAKGHPLAWSNSWAIPSWAPAQVDAMRARLRARITDIVSHFTSLVDIWDVVNEATRPGEGTNAITQWIRRDGAAAVVGECLRSARAANPKATLLYNDWNLEKVEPSYAALAAALVDAKQPVDAFGIQAHMHSGEWPLERVWEICDTYARFGKPLHFTEVTVVSGEHGWNRPAPWPTTPEGEARQADYVEKLYTELFSHPAVAAITWWDFPDGAWMGAPGGLVRADLTPKPAYSRLLNLVKSQWWTRADLVTDAGGEARFRGFLGRYRITVVSGGLKRVQEADLRPGANAITVTLRNSGTHD